MNNTIEYRNIRENRKYKDSLFRMVFKKKEDLLDLYNAINGTSYSDVDDMEVNTLENVLYISMKNDVSFVIGCSMSLYEHQSTKNANMPLRGLFYFARLYENYVTENGLDIYSSKLQKIPTPQYIVFYNGTKKEEDERILKLSDAFMKEGGCLECEVRLLNINYGHNRELMEKCRRLEEYAIFVSRVRYYTKKESLSLKKAINLAMNECIKEGILIDILTKQRNEVFGVILSTFNKELYEKNLKQNAYEDGINMTRVESVENLMNNLKVSAEEACGLLEISYEEFQKLVLAWDSDYTKMTPGERASLKEALSDKELVSHDDIDWD